ncbi:hypothetical protein [Nocardia sp. NPDC057030]|uniref:WXG100-like domain-containing protein n=1 Tax=unclassified Nocardia TaxID=2637762 RepID=UPI0036372457
MGLYLPEELRWLGWIAGATWPDGDESGMWEISAAWKAASADLTALLSEIDAAKSATMRAYLQGDGATAMGVAFDHLRTGDESLESLAQFLQTVSDSSFDAGTELEATKLNIIVSLVWLALEIIWAWLFPPTAPAAEAAAITTTRSILRVLEDKLAAQIGRLAAKLGAATEKRFFLKTLASGRLVAPTAKGWGVYSVKLLETGVTSAGLDAAVQLGQMAAGHRRKFDGTQFGVSIFASVAGTLPSREFARYLGFGLDKVIGGRNIGAWGATGRGAFIGAASGIVGSAAGNVAVGVATGSWTSFSSPSGWVGAAARGGLVGGARGGFTLKTVSPNDIRRFAWANKPTPAPAPVTNGGRTGSTRTGDGSVSVANGSGGQSHSGGSRSVTTASVSNGGGSQHGSQPSGSRGGSQNGSHSVVSGGGSGNGSHSGGSGRGSQDGSHSVTSGGGSQNGSHSAAAGGGSQNGSHSVTSAGGSPPGSQPGGGAQHGSQSAASGGGSQNGSSSGASGGGSRAQSAHAFGGGDGQSVTSSRSSTHGDGSSVRSSGGSSSSGSGRTGSFVTASEGAGGSSVRDSTGGSSIRESNGGSSVRDSVGGSSGRASIGRDSADGSSGSSRNSGSFVTAESVGAAGSPPPSIRSSTTGAEPPTSYQSSVDGGWTPPGGSVHGSPPGGSVHGSSSGGSVPGSSNSAPSVVSHPSGSSSSAPGGAGSSAASQSGSGTAGSTGSSSSRPATSGSGGSEPDRPAPRPDPNAYLGPGKDMKAKTRPKQIIDWGPMPPPFTVPAAPTPDHWIPAAAQPDEAPEVDVPFTMTDEEKKR